MMGCAVCGNQPGLDHGAKIPRNDYVPVSVSLNPQDIISPRVRVQPIVFVAKEFKYCLQLTLDTQPDYWHSDSESRA